LYLCDLTSNGDEVAQSAGASASTTPGDPGSIPTEDDPLTTLTR
jgi:hypothetical protein